LDDFGCEREKGHERGLREIHQLDPVWTLGSFWTLECKAKSFRNVAPSATTTSFVLSAVLLDQDQMEGGEVI